MSNQTNVELEALVRKDPLAFAITHVDLLDNKKWDLSTRAWLPEMFNQINPFMLEKDPLAYPTKTMAIIKSTQAGITTLAISRALHFLTNWSCRVGYMLPRTRDLIDFSTTRLEPIIKRSPFLTKKKNLYPDNASVKSLGDSYLYFLEGTVEPRSMPMDALYLDEVDLCEPEHVGTAINRMDASSWRMLTYLSTPTLPNTGIDAVFQTSDQREWVVACDCGHHQIMEWEKHLRIKGSPSDPEHVSFVCEKCERELSVQDIQRGQWVAMHPERSKDVIGYHVHQMLTTPADILYRHFRDPNQSLAEFYRKRLGKTYTMAGGSVTRDDILVNCFQAPYEQQFMAADGGDTYVMGADQGNRIHCVIGRIPKGKSNVEVVYLETIDIDKGFARLGQLAKLFRIKRGVVDRNPNAHEVRKLTKAFPSRILAADYVEEGERATIKKNEDKIDVAVAINRTENFDALLEAIREGEIGLPGTPPRLHPEVESLIDHLTSIKKDVEKRKTPSGEKDVSVYRKLRSADHYAHALGYMHVAANLDTKKKRSFRMRQHSVST